jgi:CheY-like chemotaxis protein/two-component sensor histidine kinase
MTQQLNFLRDYFKISKQLKEKENLNAIINNLKPYFERIEKNDNIKIELALDPGIPEDMLIPGQIEALITNLVDNAVLSIKVKEMEGCEGLITIRTQSAAAENNSVYTLSIRDNGRGIDEKDIPIIWSPFYSQFPNKAGLGLTICEKIISNHDASHLVESVEGEYTKFLITFTSNLTPPEREEPLRAFEEPKEDKEDINGRILIIDDEAYLVDLMKEILLNEADFDIVTSASGPEALKLLDGSFDVIISDVRMPEINGMDIYEALQARGIQSKMLMVTADPFSEDVWTFLNKNKIDYLKKPFELMEFKKRVLDKLS